MASKALFYRLYLFFLVYVAVIVWSYYVIDQDRPLTSAGMFVSFPNPYEHTGVNGGRLISTIIAYYLTPVAMLLPFVLLFLKQFRQKGFYHLELLVLIMLSLFSLYLAAMMGRRTTFVLLGVVFVLLLLIGIRSYVKMRSFYLITFLFSIVTAFVVYQTKEHPKDTKVLQAVVVSGDIIVPIEAPESLGVSCLLAKLQKTPVYDKLIHRGLSDSRFRVWIKGLQAMMAYPFGGGHSVRLSQKLKLAHNAWIDIGKDFGVVPFVLFVLVTLWHLCLLGYLLLSGFVEPLLKYLLVVLTLSFFAIMMIEPVFNSDKTFFAYFFFYFGVIANIYRKIRAPKVR